jgi:hypothetical protein
MGKEKHVKLPVASIIGVKIAEMLKIVFWQQNLSIYFYGDKYTLKVSVTVERSIAKFTYYHEPEHKN